MARIKYASIVSEVSGSVGSATFQKSLYGNTLRNRPRPHKSGTAAQLYARSIMMQCQYAWRALDPATRKQWDQYIAFSGASINRDRGILMTGHSLYLKYNFTRLIASLAILNTPAYVSAPQWPSLIAIRVNGNILYMEFSVNPFSTNIYSTSLFSPLRLSSQSFSKQGLRFMVSGIHFQQYYYFNNSYLPVFGRMLVPGDVVHVQHQLWLSTAPILSAIQTAVFTVVLL